MRTRFTYHARDMVYTKCSRFPGENQAGIRKKMTLKATFKHIPADGIVRELNKWERRKCLGGGGGVKRVLVVAPTFCAIEWQWKAYLDCILAKPELLGTIKAPLQRFCYKNIPKVVLNMIRSSKAGAHLRLPHLKKVLTVYFSKISNKY